MCQKQFLYVSAGVLESPEDFESSEELYEAVGGMIEGALGEDEEERDVHILCQQLFSIALGYVCPFLFVYSLKILEYFTCREMTCRYIGEHKTVNLQTQIFTYYVHFSTPIYRGFAVFHGLTCTSTVCMLIIL